jgi:hypothetical protein
VKIAIEAIPEATFAELDQVHRNVESVSLEPAASPPQGTLEIERMGDVVRWRLGSRSLVLPVSAISDLYFAPVTHGPNRFWSVTLAFESGGKRKLYSMISAHETKAAWVKSALSDIARLFEKPISEWPPNRA